MPGANSDTSKSPIGPFQKMVFAPTILCRYSSRVFGPMSSPSIPSGICASVCTATPLFGSLATTWSAGSSTSTRDCPAFSRMRRATSILSFSTRDAPTGTPRADRNVYAIAPPIRSASTFPIS